jgi:hypothetical protein
MLWLYVGWRMLRRVWLVLLAGAVALVVLAVHPQTDLRQAMHGRGALGHQIQRLRHDLQRGLERHLRPPDDRSDHPPRVERSGSR